MFNSIFDSIFDSRLSKSTSLHQFYDSASTWLRLQSFGIRLDNKPWVRTPLRRNLEGIVWLKINKHFTLKSSCRNHSKRCHANWSFLWPLPPPCHAPMHYALMSHNDPPPPLSASTVIWHHSWIPISIQSRADVPQII